MIMKNKYWLLAAVAAGLMTGCGGSGGGSGSDGGETGSNNVKVVISGDLSPSVNESVALIATVDKEMSDKANISWTQTAGPSLTLLAANSAVLAFDIKEAGSYSFKVDFTTASGKALSESVSFTTATRDNVLNVRRDFATREENKVSFKLSAPVDADGKVVSGKYTNVVWKQTAGKSVTLDAKNTNIYIAIFKAPTTFYDSTLTFDVSATHPNGETYTDKVHLLVQNIVSIKNTAIYKKVIAKVSPYNASAPMADGLKNCVYANYFIDSCSMSKINLIGQDHSAPTVDEIMNRVVTSHPWMAKNFKLFLEEQDVNGDFKSLLRSVSAIVISYDIRPSYYWPVTGAIYLDPADLWLTPEERDSIDVAPDYRGEFGQELQYIMANRYVKNNEKAGSYYAPDLRIIRTTDDIVPDLASLLYHELAHANDVFPSNTLGNIVGKTVYSEYLNRKNNTISNQLTNAPPKISEEMMALGQVQYQGAKATAEQIAYLPDDVAGFFSSDNAAAEYSYSSIQEDVAMLFDATMMSLRYGISRDNVVMTPKLEDVDKRYILSWGQRNRIADAAVLPRAKFVFERIMPELDTDALFATLPEARQLQAGLNWWDSIQLDAKEKRASRARSVSQDGISRVRPIEDDLIRKYK